MAARPLATLGHVTALDGMRGFAAILVVLVHCQRNLVPGAHFMLDIFFALSGYLITHLLLDEVEATGRLHVGKFYCRRALRLLPALFLLIAGHLLITAINTPNEMAIGVRRALVATFYLGSWFRAFMWDDLGQLGHTWSLSVEEQFYLLLPLAIFAYRPTTAGVQRLQKLLMVGLVAVLAIKIPIASYAGDGSQWPEWFVYHSVITRADGFALGCLAALAVKHRSRFLGIDVCGPWPIRLAGLAVLSIAVLCFVGKPWCSRWVLMVGNTYAAAAASIIIIRITCGPENWWWSRVLNHRVLRYVGVRSYAMYLWHLVFIHQMGIAGINLPGWFRIPLVFALSLAAAEVSYRLIERPCLALKNRISRIPQPEENDEPATLPMPTRSSVRSARAA